VGFSDALALADQAVQDHLGDPVTYTPGVGAPVAVTGVFDAVYVNAASGKAEVSTGGPAVFLMVADLSSDPTTDLNLRVTIYGVTYKPREVEPDGKGGVLIHLHQV
jgi:hypothetical protein